jgi:hypothetical protein
MRVTLLALVAALSLAAHPARADDPDFVAVGVGGFDVNDDETTFQGRIEYRGERLVFLKPIAGFMVTGDAGLYGYGGLLVDVYLGRRWVVTPSFAAGAYAEGDGKDLGGTLQFRSAIELAYRLDDRSRLGLAFDHISNAGLYEENPGTESLVLIYAIPLD